MTMKLYIYKILLHISHSLLQSVRLNFPPSRFWEGGRGAGQTHLVINEVILSIKLEIVPLFITYYSLLLTCYLLLITSAYTLNLDAFALGRGVRFLGKFETI